MKILDFINVSKIFGQFTSVKISPKLAYKIMKFNKVLEEDQVFYQNKYNELIQTYSEKDELGEIMIDKSGIVKIMPDKIEEANQKLQELNNIEVEIPNIKFTLDELSELQLSVEEIYYLDPFIVEE